MRHFEDGHSWKYDPIIGNFVPEGFAIDVAELWNAIASHTLIFWGTES
jgi:hypothetical protein